MKILLILLSAMSIISYAKADVKLKKKTDISLEKIKKSEKTSREQATDTDGDWPFQK